MDDNNDRNSRPLFQGIDEFERTYAPQELPEDDPARQLVEADEGMSFTDVTDIEETSAEPVASVGSSPSGDMANPGFDQGDGTGEGVDDMPDDEG